MKKYISILFLVLILLVGCSDSKLIHEDQDGLKATSFFNIMNSDKFSLTIDPTIDKKDTEKITVTTNSDKENKSITLKSMENSLTVIETPDKTYVLLHENKMGYESKTDPSDLIEVKDFDYEHYEFLDRGVNEDKLDYETYKLGDEIVTFYFDGLEIKGFSTDTVDVAITHFNNKPEKNAFTIPKDYEIEKE